MINIYLLTIELIICLIVMLLTYKLFKLEGLYVYMISMFILSNIMTLKLIPIFEFDTNLGIVPLATIFIASNIIVQKQGPEEIKKVTLTIIAFSIISFGILYLTSQLESSNINLFTNKSYDNIFMESERIYFANIATLLYSLLLNSKLYSYLKSVKNKIWISNIFASIIIQFIASILFNILAYIFVKELIEIIELIVLRYMISLIATIIGTINIYISIKKDFRKWNYEN